MDGGGDRDCVRGVWAHGLGGKGGGRVSKRMTRRRCRSNVTVGQIYKETIECVYLSSRGLRISGDSCPRGEIVAASAEHLVMLPAV